MCGIAGIVGRNIPQDEKARLMRKLLEATQVRGTDATGIAVPSEDGTIRFLKAPVEAKTFIESEEYREFMDENIGATVMIGHCRAKTQGDPKDNGNNHPIVSERTQIAVIHNGSVRDAQWRVKNEEGTNPYMLDDFDAAVDSEAILRLVDTLLFIPREEDGTIRPSKVAATPKDQWTRNPNITIEKAIEDAVFNLSGGQSCALIAGEEPNTLYMWRTTNPAVIAYIPEWQALVFASTEAILKNALRNKKYNFILDYFMDEQSDFPEHFTRETDKDYVTKIVCQDDPDQPFVFSTKELDPNGAATIRSAVERGDKVEVTNQAVDPATAN